MTTGTRRDPRADHLITPENAALLVIDYQPSQVASIRSMDSQLLLKNVVSTAKTAKAFGLPIVHSTINVASGRGKPTIPELAAVLEDNPPIDRTSINSWEDADFVAAVRSTGRRKRSSAPCGPRSAWRFQRSTLCARALRSIPSSTPSAARQSKRIAPVSTVSLSREGSR